MVIAVRGLLALALASCVALAGSCAVVDAPVRQPARGAEIASPWQNVSGGWLAGGASATHNERLRLARPTAVSAAGDLVVIFDAASSHVLAYDRSRDSVRRIAHVEPGHPGTSVHVAAGPFVYVVRSSVPGLVRVDARTGAERSYALPGAIGASSVAFDAATGEVVIGDERGALLGVDRDGRARSIVAAGSVDRIAAVAAAREGIFVVDATAQRVVVFDRGGAVRRAFGDDALIAPHAIAVDAAGRVFVADAASGSIHVFAGNVWIGQIGGIGSPVKFGRIRDIAADDHLLYVADETAGRVQVLLIAPESLHSNGART